jgi:hypothetical protein
VLSLILFYLNLYFPSFSFSPSLCLCQFLRKIGFVQFFFFTYFISDFYLEQFGFNNPMLEHVAEGIDRIKKGYAVDGIVNSHVHAQCLYAKIELHFMVIFIVKLIEVVL